VKATTMFSGAVLVAMGALAGCAAPAPRPIAANEARPLSLTQCENVTGSRIRTRGRSDCAPVGYPFKNFTAEEIEATGQTDLNQALRQMDPAFR